MIFIVLIQNKKNKRDRYYSFVFRVDHIIATFLIACFVDQNKLTKPVLLKQERVGIYEKSFDILKFRNMRVEDQKETMTHLLENSDQYITRVGKFLIKTSLDELPQIINIFKCELSIVEPIPALWNLYDLI